MKYAAGGIGVPARRLMVPSSRSMATDDRQAREASTLITPAAMTPAHEDLLVG